MDSAAETAFAKFVGCVDQDSRLKPTLRELYRNSALRVMNGMGQVALETWELAVNAIVFYASISDLDAKARSLGSNPIGRHTGLTITWHGRIELHLDGGSENDQRSQRRAADYYAHEFAHAVDVRGAFSRTKEWQEVWSAECNNITASLPGREGEPPYEGFADLAILAWLYPESARRHAPACWDLWVSWKLV